MLQTGRCLARACGSGTTVLRISLRRPVLQQPSRNVTALPSFRIMSLRRRIAERFANRYDENRVAELGPDLACLEWLMECGATEVLMNDGSRVTSIAEMRRYLKGAKEGEIKPPPGGQLQAGDLAFEEKWPHVLRLHIVKVDASDSAIANPGFPYFRECKRIETLKMNFCDYFGDEGLRELALGRPATTLKDIEIVLNPCVTDGAVYWLSRLKALRRAHFYFIPYITNRTAFIRQLRTALPRCEVTFPEVDQIGYGYENEKNAQKKR